MSMLTLPTERERARRHVPRLAREQIFLDSTVVQRVREVAPAGADAAVFAAFQVLLYRLTGQEHFTIGVCASASAVPEALMTLGSADGAVAVACQTSGDSRFGSLIAAADAALRSAAAVGPAAPVPMPPPDDLLSPLCFAAGDLLLLAAPAAGHLAVMCEFDDERFEPAVIRRWLGALQLLLDAGIAQPDRAVSALPWLPAADPAVLERVNDTAAAMPDVCSDRGPGRPSLAQERTWLLEAMNPNHQIVHNLSCAWRLDGALDALALERSLSAVVARHEALRTRVIVRDGQPLQEVVSDAVLALARIDLTELPPEARELALLKFCDSESRTPHDLSRPPLLRASLIETGDDQHVLLVVPHHLIWDGWSADVFLRDLAALYAEATGVAAAPLPDLLIAYRDFARWQREWLETTDGAEQRTWWGERLAGQLPVLRMPTDRQRPEAPTLEAVHVTTTLPPVQLEALTDLGLRSGATVSAVLFAALCVVLHRASEQNDVLVGVPAHGRTRPETGDVIGSFVNMLVLRSTIDADTRFSDLLTRTRNTALEAFGHQDLPLEAADARAPVLRAFFTFDDARQRPERMGTVRVSSVVVPPPAVAADVRLAITHTRDGLNVTWTCSAELFEQSTAQRFLERLEMVLEAVLRDPDASIAGLDLIGPVERAQLQSFGAAQGSPEPGVCVHTLVERHAARAPGDEALVFGDEVIEYGTLDQQATAVARALAARGVDRGATVGVYLSRSADLVTSLLGIMKAGAVSVLLDPADPPFRSLAILEHSRAALVVTDTARRRQLPPSGLPIVCVDEAVPGPADAADDPAVPASLDAAACLLYACEAREVRSTPVSHGTLAALLGAVRRELSLTHEDVALAISTPSLDVLLIELLAPLSAGGCVVIADDDVARDSDRLIEAVGRSATTVMIAPTMVWTDLLATTGMTWPRLKAICFGAVPGPATQAELVGRTEAAWFAQGSADGTIWTTLRRLTDQDSGQLLGRPMDHVSLRIVDARDRLVPIGACGELQAKIEHRGGPASASAAVWTTTGHQTRWRADGDIELVAGAAGRAYVDGFRIHLDDVSRAIRLHGTVEDAEAVLETSASPPRLVACVVPRPGAAYSVSELRRELRRTVPAAMVPQAFVEVGSIPRGADGRAAFAVGGETRSAGSTGHVAPETATEQMLASLWSEALGIAQVSVHDNFFALGGYSLLCFQVLTRLERATGQRLSPRLLLVETLRQVAGQIDAGTLETGHQEAPAPRAGRRRVLPRQRRSMPRSA
jgi:non-ribosomal peptide synthetase component F